MRATGWAWVLGATATVMLAACGSGDGGQADDVGGLDVPGIELNQPDPGGRDAPADASPDAPPVDGTPDPGAPDTEPDAAPDTASDAADDVPSPSDTTPPGDATEADVAPSSPYTQAFVDARCAAYCELLAQCDTADAACADDCRAAVADDPAYAANLVCWTTSNSCDAHALCFDGPVPAEPRCTAACGQAETCGLYPSEFLGANAAECDVLCSSFAWIMTSAGQQAALDCIVDKIEACDSLGLGQCLQGGGNPPCDEVCASLTACQNIPGLFESAEACHAACEGYGQGPALAALACATVGNDEGDTLTAESCASQASCFPPPDAPADGVAPLCSALLAKCAGQPGFELPNDLTVCGWLITGFLVRFPGADLVDGAACIQAKPDCADPDKVMACLLPPYAPCPGACQALDACMPAPPPAEWPGVDACAEWCTMSHAADPAGTEAIVQCIALSEECGTTLACVPHDQ